MALLKRRHAGALVAGALALTAAFGCGDTKTLPTEPGGEPPDETATFTRVQNEVFTPNCALAGCHAGASPKRGMNLSAGMAYANTVGVPSVERPALDRIEPGNPELSYLVKKIRGDADISGSPMPLTGEITGDQVQLVVDWVRRGAPND